MSLIDDLYQTPTQFASLKLNLVDNVSAYALAQLIGATDRLYFFSLWLDLAERYSGPGFFPDEYSPTTEETLWISAIEIGTPNRLKLKGIKTNVVAVAGIIAALLTVPKGVTDVMKGVAETEHIRVEQQLTEADIRLREIEAYYKTLDAQYKRLEIIEKAHELYNQGKISREARDHKIEETPKIINALREGCSVVVPEIPEVEEE